MYLVSLQGHGTSAWPGLERGADGVHGRHERPVGAHRLEDRGADAGHDAHRDDDVLGVGELDAEHRVLGLDRAHAERDDVHRPAAHAPAVQLGHDRLHLGRVHPVVGGTGVGLVDRADEGAVLDPGDVAGVGGAVEGVGLRVEPAEGAGVDQLRR